MIVVCSWCGRRKGMKEPLTDVSVTHTICAECSKRLLAQVDEILKPQAAGETGGEKGAP